MSSEGERGRRVENPQQPERRLWGTPVKKCTVIIRGEEMREHAIDVCQLPPLAPSFFNAVPFLEHMISRYLDRYGGLIVRIDIADRIVTCAVNYSTHGEKQETHLPPLERVHRILSSIILELVPSLANSLPRFVLYEAKKISQKDIVEYLGEKRSAFSLRIRDMLVGYPQAEINQAQKELQEREYDRQKAHDSKEIDTLMSILGWKAEEFWSAALERLKFMREVSANLEREIMLNQLIVPRRGKAEKTKKSSTLEFKIGSLAYTVSFVPKAEKTTVPSIRFMSSVVEETPEYSREKTEKWNISIQGESGTFPIPHEENSPLNGVKIQWNPEKITIIFSSVRATVVNNDLQKSVFYDRERSEGGSSAGECTAIQAEPPGAIQPPRPELPEGGMEEKK